MKKIYNLMEKFVVIIVILSFYSNVSYGQKPQTQVNGFGHVEFTYVEDTKNSAYFSIGEHDLFVSSKIKNKISFLGEYVFRFSGNNYIPSIERSFAKFNYVGNHSIIAGKVHTPVNYWNDVYHHGRLFFPTIDRPLAFSHIIPLHTLGFQLQGQNLGKLNFGYDLVLGNGISSTDVKQTDMNFSVTASAHIKPADNLRIGASYYHDYLQNNKSGMHSGHNASPDHYAGELYTGPLTFDLACFSISYFGNKFELLSESSFNATRTDSLGQANNYSSFLYAGFRIKERHVPYIILDYLKVDKDDLHVYEFETAKVGVGYKHEFNHLICLKTQLEYQMYHHNSDEHHVHNKLGVRLQLAYGF
jgi:hypothetical protein